MSPTPKLSIIIPWCNRSELQATLLNNAPWFEERDAEVLIVNCAGDSALLRQLVANAPIENLRCYEVPASRFNRSLTLNVGIRFSRSSKLFILDCDIEIHSDVFSDALHLLGENAFVTLGRVQESDYTCKELSAALSQSSALDAVDRIESSHTIEFRWSDGSQTVIDVWRNLIDGSRSARGMLFANKEHLVGVDGYNSDLECWGWEDNDLHLRLMRALSLAHFERGSAVHLSHGNDLRALYGLDPSRASLTNLRTACLRYARGDFRGTYSRDVSRWMLSIREITVDAIRTHDIDQRS